MRTDQEDSPRSILEDHLATVDEAAATNYTVATADSTVAAAIMSD